MAQDTESFNSELYDLLKVRGYKPTPLNSQNQRVRASQEADVLEFTFVKDGEDYGKAWISIDDASNVKIYFDDEQQDSPGTTTPGVQYDDTWTGFLKHVKQWAQRRQLSFELANKDRLGDDMRQRDYYKMKEKLGESYHPMGKKASYNDAVPNVKIVLQHNRSLEEGEARYRNVARIYLENVDGERFLAPTNKPGLARVYARHIAEGGVPNDDRWNHIKSMCEDYAKMAGFVRATKNGQFNESAQALVQEGVNHYNSLRETLHKLSGHRGYHAYFESYTPPLMEDEVDESINELFVQEKVDPRIESAMPILSRLKKPVSEMTEVDNLAEWADEIISEKLELDEMDKEHGSKRDFDNAKGPDKTAKPVTAKKASKDAGKALNKAFKNVKEDGEPKKFNEYEVFNVHIPANVYSGKYHDYRTAQYMVFKGMDGVETAQDAIDWVNNHKDQVLADLDSRRIPYGNRKVKLVRTPAAKNVFFKDKYHVKPGKVSRSSTAPAKANFDPSALGQANESNLNELSTDKIERYMHNADKEALQHHNTSKAIDPRSEKAIELKKKYKQRAAGLGMAGKKLAGLAKVPATESEEQVNEISKDKAGKYINRARQSLDDLRWKSYGDYNGEEDGWDSDLDDDAIKAGEKHDKREKMLALARAKKNKSGETAPHYTPHAKAKVKATEEQVEEDLGPEQKKVGQLGPTEKVKNNNIGKLVGASESKEIPAELARIIEMAKFKR